MKQLVIALVLIPIIFSCKTKESPPFPVPEPPMLIFKFKFDSTQVRLNGFGSPSTVLVGNAAQSPLFNKMSAHYIELAPDSLTQVGQGRILYNGASTISGGASAIDFEKEIQVGEGGTFFSVPLKDVAPGTYKWLRVSLAYQNYVVKFRTSVPVVLNLTGTLASFVGFNTYIKSFKVKDSVQVVNSNKRQGFWAFETNYTLDSASAPGTTVSNPISATSPIPAGSCLATGRFQPNFTITGNENKDIIITVSLSTNKSFEWKDPNGNGIWEPDLNNEPVVDMGLRGLIPIVQY